MEFRLTFFSSSCLLVDINVFSFYSLFLVFVFVSKVILIADPSLRKQLLIKKALIDRAVEGMGHHGLVGTSNDALMNLHEALRLEFERVIQQYKGAIAKIDELSATNKNGKDGGPITRSLSQGPAPTFSSHQRLLSLKQEEIQDRLNKNRSLLCALEPCFRTNHSLQILLAILQKRIDYDKETLFQFGQLSREYSTSSSSSSNGSSNVVVGSSSSSTSSSSSSSSSSLSSSNNHNHNQNSTMTNFRNNHHKSRTLLSNQFERDSVVAPVLMRFSHGCNQVCCKCFFFNILSLDLYFIISFFFDSFTVSVFVCVCLCFEAYPSSTFVRQSVIHRSVG